MEEWAAGRGHQPSLDGGGGGGGGSGAHRAGRPGGGPTP
eukprot:COSAG02_NODE_1301_length_13367_cov_14.080570_16_plen_38_part_01